MRKVFDLDASEWRGFRDFYDALFVAIGAPEWHGRSVDALVDSMIWGGINSLEPPYTVRICGITTTTEEVRDAVTEAQHYVSLGREEYRDQKKRDIDVGIEICA